jgi:hypothetical protein
MAKQMLQRHKKTSRHERMAQHTKPTRKAKRAHARNPVTREPITDTVEVIEIEVASGPTGPLQADELELSWVPEEESVFLKDEE